MPCYEENLISIQWSGKSKSILEKIGVEFWNETEGYYNSVSINLEKGIASSAYQSRINALKKAYSLETVRQAAKKQGWKVLVKADNKLQLIKYEV